MAGGNPARSHPAGGGGYEGGSGPGLVAQGSVGKILAALWLDL